MSSRFTSALVSSVCAAVAATTSSSFAQITPTVLFGPGDAVPGRPGLTFGQFGFNDTTFNRPFLSPNGQFYAVETFVGTDSSLNEGLLAGPIGGGTLVLRDGDAAAFNSGQTITSIGGDLRVNSSGVVAVALDTTGDQPNFVTTYDLNTNANVAVVREGGPVGPVPGESYGVTLNFTTITEGGDVGFFSNLSTGVLPSSQDTFYQVGNRLIAQSGVTQPTGQVPGENRFLQNLDFGATSINGDGSRYILQGDLEGSSGSDDVIIVDGRVVAQQGQALASDPLSRLVGDLNSTRSEPFMAASGDWIAYGQFQTGAPGSASTSSDPYWVVLNDTLITETGDAIVGGSTETWSTIFAATVNGVGDYLLAGVTSEGDAAIVFNGTEILFRTGSGVDITGDGVADDAFFSTFGTDDFALADNRRLLLSAYLVDGAGVELGEHLITVVVPAPASLSLLAASGLVAMRRRR